MAFSAAERQALLELKGVGPTVIKRIENIGIDSFESLAKVDAATVATMVASMLGSTCWKNSPQARAAIATAIERARQGY